MRLSALLGLLALAGAVQSARVPVDGHHILRVAQVSGDGLQRTGHESADYSHFLAPCTSQRSAAKCANNLQHVAQRRGQFAVAQP